MYNNKKRVVVLVAVMVLFFNGRAMAQTIVLDKFQLGKSTYDEVKANLPKGVLIVHDDSVPIEFYGGRTLSTDGTGYGVDGLRAVYFSFDEKQTLVSVGMRLETRRFYDIKKILASQYEPVRSDYPSSLLVFKANQDYIQLFVPEGKVYNLIPGDNLFAVEYMTSAIARKQRQTKQYKNPEERKIEELKNRKMLDRKFGTDRSKF